MVHRITAGLLPRLFAAAASLTAFAASAGATVVWNESVNGDISNNRLAPTPFFLDSGVNSFILTTGFPDREYMTINVPASATFNAIFLMSYVGNDQIGFIGMQSGTVMTEDPNNPDPSNLLGWAHFGPGFGQLGTDILDDMAFGGMGFTAPLPSGNYTFWIQQLGSPATYQLDFILVPAPSSALAFAAFAGAATLRRRRV